MATLTCIAVPACGMIYSRGGAGTYLKFIAHLSCIKRGSSGVKLQLEAPHSYWDFIISAEEVAPSVINKSPHMSSLILISW